MRRNRRRAISPLNRPPIIREKLNKRGIIDDMHRTINGRGIEITREQINAVLFAQVDQVERAMRPTGIGVYKIPGLVKIERYMRKPTRKRVGQDIRAGKAVEIPARPAKPAVRFEALVELREVIKPLRRKTI